MSFKVRLPIALGLLLAGAAVVAPPVEPRASASLVVALDLPTMVERADLVAVVDVVSVSAAWDDKHERILTTVELSVVESWKGPMAPASHVTIVQPGGQVGDIQMTVFGMSQFTRGERALVFLRGTPSEASVVGHGAGQAHGAPRRRHGALDGARAQPPGRDVRARAPGSSTSTADRLRDALRGLDDLRTEVRGLVGKSAR